MYNGKHHRTGHALTVISTLEGNTVYISEAYPGATHDKTASTSPDIAAILNSAHTAIGDKGYLGTPCLTPYKNYRKRPLTETQQAVNSQINKLRAPVERSIAQLKIWRILHTPYRRPLRTWKHTLHAVKGLHFLKQIHKTFE